jgi:hypothetical protein
MNRSIPILILTALSAVVFADESMASQQTDQVLKDTEVRQKQMLTSMLHTPYPPKGSSGGPSLWHYEDFAMAAYWLNQPPFTPLRSPQRRPQAPHPKSKSLCPHDDSSRRFWKSEPINPLSPPSGPAQRLAQGPTPKANS